jgi:Family of unknown function (DUF6804)
MKRSLGLYIAWLIVAVMLASAAVGRHPYTFYTLLRWICCPIFAYSTFAAYEKNRSLWIWIFGVLALLYNPIFRVHLDRSTWIGVNWFTVGVIVAAAISFWRPKRRSPSVTTDSQTQKADTKQDRAVKLDGYYRFQPNVNSVGAWRLEKDLSDLAPGDIVKVVTTPENGMCHVNKPGNCPVIATMELVNPEWLEPVNAKFKECEYCAGIDHQTSDCPYRGKVPYGWKGTGPWRIEGGKMFFDEGKPDETKSHFPLPPEGYSDKMNTLTQKELDQVVRIDPNQLKNVAERAHKVHNELSDWLTASSKAKTYIEMWDSLLAHILKMQPELDAMRADIQVMSDPTGKFIEHEFIVKYGDLVSLSQMRAQIQVALNECLKPRADGWFDYVCRQVDLMEQAFKSIFSQLDDIVDRNKL